MKAKLAKLYHVPVFSLTTSLIPLCLSFLAVPNVTEAQQVTPLDWIVVSNETWPPADGVENQQKTPFYLAYAGTPRHPTFGLNAKHLSTVEKSVDEHGELKKRERVLLSKPSLSFRYWTNTDTGMFRSKLPGRVQSKRQQQRRDLKLGQTFKWKDARLKDISVEEWASLKYEYADDRFTLALKDVRVEVLERESASKLPRSPIHGYRKSEALLNFEKVSTPESILAAASPAAKVAVDKVTLSAFTAADESVLRFELLAIPNDDGEVSSASVSIKVSPKEKSCEIEATQNSNGIKLEDKIGSIKCTTKEVSDGGIKKNILSSFELTLKKEKFSAFVIIPKLPSTVKLTATEAVKPLGQTYKVSAKANQDNFLSFIDSQPSGAAGEEDASHDMCYSLIQIDSEQLNSKANHPVTFDLYLTYPDAPSGLHLDKITSVEKTFCLNDYIGLRLLKDYQLTLSVSADSQVAKRLPPKPFHLLLAKRPVKTALKLVTPKHASPQMTFTNSWHYSNRAFNYRIEGPLDGKGGQTNFSACDITGNCFRYTPKPAANSNQFQYDLEPAFLDELAKSPFLRIKSDLGAVTDAKFSFGYDENSDMNVLDKILKKFFDLNPQFVGHSTSATSDAHVVVSTDLNSKVEYRLNIPINFIDLRVSHLSFRLEADSSHNAPTFAFKGLTFNNTKSKVVSDFTQFHKYRLLSEKRSEVDEPEMTNMSTLAEVAISTADFFHYDSFETDSTVEGYFTLAVAAFTKAGNNDNTKTKAAVKMTIELVDATASSSSSSKLKLQNLPVTIPPNPHFHLLNTAITPMVSISSGPIRFKGARSGVAKQPLPPFRMKLTFKKDNAFNHNDLQINRIVRSQGLATSEDVSLRLRVNQSDTTSAVFEEDNNSEANETSITVSGGFFEIIYELVLASNSDGQIEVGIEYFEVDKPPFVVSAFRGPIIGTIDPGTDVSLPFISCPYLFVKSVDTKNKSFCQLDQAYYRTSTSCSEGGCSNIFSTPLPTSSVYFDPNFEKAARNRYYPNTLTMSSGSKKNIEESQYLHVSLNRTAVGGNESHSAEADYCLQFGYASAAANTGSESAIWVSTDPKAAFSIDFPPPTQNKKSRQQNRTICQSWLSQRFASVEELYFRFDKNSPLVDLDRNYLEVLPTPKWGAEVVTFESGITRIKEAAAAAATGANQPDWSKLFVEVSTESPTDTTFKLDTYGTIEFTIRNLKAPKSNSSSKLISHSRLRTGWIRSMGRLREELYLTAVPSGDALGREHLLTVSLTVSSSTDGPLYYLPNLNTLSLANISSEQQPLQLNLSQSVNYYQLTFDFRVDLSKPVTTESSSATLKLSSLSINDACSSRSVVSSLQNGGLRPCNAHGSCVTANYHAYSAACHCRAGFAGDACSIIDYCTALNKETGLANELTCIGSSKCISSPQLKTFLCQCLQANETWNAAAGSCLKTTIEACEENEVRVLSADRATTSSSCVCREGFVKVKEPSANSNTSNNATCTAYNVCDEAHRRAKGVSPIKPCTDPNAECKQKTQGPNSYECLCKADFYNQFEIKSSKAQCRAEVCKSCEQTCKQDSTTKKYVCACEQGYTLEESTGKCVPGPSVDQSKCRSNQTNAELPPAFLRAGSYCACPANFRFNTTSKLCDLDQALAGKFGCTRVELKSAVDHQPGCVCLEGQQFDPATRGCTAHCTEEKAKECDLKGASCEVASGKAVECQCPSGFVLLAEGDPEKATCVSKCQLLEKYSQYSAFRCTGQFQHCNSENVVLDPAKLIAGKIFLIGNSSVTSSPSQHCSCDFGFEMSKTTTSGISSEPSQCTVSSVPVKFIRDVPFEVPAFITAAEEEERKTYASGTIRPAFISLMGALFGVKSVVRRQSTCQYVGSPTSEVLCTAAITTRLASRQVLSQLSSSCVYSADNRTCMYYTAEENGSGSGGGSFEYQQQLLTTAANLAAAAPAGPKKLVNVLARDATKEIKVESIDYCASPDRCSAHPDSHCKTATVKEGDGEEEVAYFECLCEPTFFTASSSQSLLTTTGGRSLQLQSCRQRDLCFEQKETYGCADSTATCSLVLHDLKNGNYSAHTFCTCPPETGGSGGSGKNGIVLPSRDRLCSSLSACGNGHCQNGGQCAVDMTDPAKVLCHCADGFEGERCEKKKGTDKVANQSSVGGVSSGYRTATIILSVFFSLCLIVLVFVAIKAFTGFNVVLYVNQLIRRERS